MGSCGNWGGGGVFLAACLVFHTSQSTSSPTVCMLVADRQEQVEEDLGGRGGHFPEQVPGGSEGQVAQPGAAGHCGPSRPSAFRWAVSCHAGCPWPPDRPDGTCGWPAGRTCHRQLGRGWLTAGPPAGTPPAEPSAHGPAHDAGMSALHRHHERCSCVIWVKVKKTKCVGPQLQSFWPVMWGFRMQAALHHHLDVVIPLASPRAFPWLSHNPMAPSAGFQGLMSCQADMFGGEYSLGVIHLSCLLLCMRSIPTGLFLSIVL